MYAGSQVLQVCVKWPNLTGIYWAVTQGHVHSGMALGRTDAASARFAKGPWMGFLVGVMGVKVHFPNLPFPPSSTGHRFALIMNSNRNFLFPIPLIFFSQIEIAHLAHSCKVKRLQIAALRDNGLFCFQGVKHWHWLMSCIATYNALWLCIIY